MRSFWLLIGWILVSAAAFGRVEPRYMPGEAMVRTAAGWRVVRVQPGPTGEEAPQAGPYRLEGLSADRASDVGALCAALKSQPGVLNAEPNYILDLCYTPSDPLFANQSAAFTRIHVQQAWDAQAGAVSSVIVAVIDSGCDVNHPDLAGRIAPGQWDFVDGDSDVADDIGHGTRIAGIIAAAGNNAEGIAGVAFGCRILPLDVATADGTATVDRVAQAIPYAAAHGAKAINLSLRTFADSSALREACAAASAAAVIAAAAGNDAQGAVPVYPAAYDNVIGVAATDLTDARASFSNYNSPTAHYVDLAAPGAQIYSTIPAGMYEGRFGSGTSFATPMVSGAAALLQSRYSWLSPDAVRLYLLRTARPLGDWAGAGLLDVNALVHVSMAPELSVKSVTVDDNASYSASNDADGALDKGETAKIVVELQSKLGDGVNVSAALSTSDPDIVPPISDPTASYGSIPAGASEDNSADPFANIVVSASAAAHDAPFNLHVTGDHGLSATLPFALGLEDEVQIAGVESSYAFQADKTYHVTGNLLLRDATTIPAGTLIKVDPGVDIKADLNCALTAIGTPSKPIRFTSTRPGSASWGRLWIAGSATSATLQHCVVENGAGALNDIADTAISHCVFQNNSGDGLKSTAGTSAIANTTSTLNLEAGIDAGSRALDRCAALYNNGAGLVGAALANCVARGNGGNALTGTTAADCVAEFNTGDGATLTGSALRVTARNNRGNGIVVAGGDVTNCEATQNDGVGITIAGGGTASGSKAANNGVLDSAGAVSIASDGIATGGSTVSNCVSQDNTGVGVRGPGASAVQNSRIVGNRGGAVAGVTTVNGCAVADNTPGITGASTVSLSYVGNNTGAGVAGGAISDSSIVGNSAEGVNGLTSLTNCWVVNNAQFGVRSAGGTGTVSNSTIRGNPGGGVKDIRSLAGCNIWENGNNGMYEAVDDVIGSGTPNRDFEGNWWGPTHTPYLQSHAEFEDLPFLLDTLDGSGDWLIDVWPYLPSLAPDAPDATPPAFVASMTPDVAGVGVATFTITFSKTMDRTQAPTVTFDRAAPYAAHVIEGAWTWAERWQGTYEISNKLESAPYTARIAGARDFGGFVIPDDTSRRFAVDLSTGLVADNFTPTVQGDTSIRLTWDLKPDATVTGYHIGRSRSTDIKTFARINPNKLSMAATAYTDSELTPGATYCYILYSVESAGQFTEDSAQYSPMKSATTTGAPVPEIDVNPTSLPFGDRVANTGASAAQTVNVDNLGAADLTFRQSPAGIRIVGTNADQFQFVAPPPLTALPGAQRRSLQVAFNPTSSGPKTATLEIVSNDSDEGTVSVGLSGVGTAVPTPDINCSTYSLPFGRKEVSHGAAGPLTVMIQNLGGAALSFASITITGTHASQFYFEGHVSPSTAALEEGDTRDVRVCFDPTTAGSKTAQLQIMSNDPDEGTVNVALTGEGYQNAARNWEEYE
ncbi:MAG: S8 family serine peptidase [Candidatus Sumerlaeota bacterium]|nr:S8 family serine peptidase [Candidatus Sumerlaeota bacterium]